MIRLNNVQLDGEPISTRTAALMFSAPYPVTSNKIKEWIKQGRIPCMFATRARVFVNKHTIREDVLRCLSEDAKTKLCPPPLAPISQRIKK